MGELNASAPFIGLNLLHNESEIAPNEATVALNVNLDKGTIRKRDGYTEVNDVGKCLGLIDWKYSTTGVRQIFKATTKLYKLESGSTTEIGTGMTSGTLASFVSFQGRVYVADKGKFKITDGTDVYNVEIARYDMSGSPPTITATETGDIAGEFDYKFTYKIIIFFIYLI